MKRTRKAFIVMIFAALAALPGLQLAAAPRQKGRTPAPVLGQATLLQQALNLIPTIPIAGNNLKFQFGGDVWIANNNNKPFMAGIATVYETAESTFLLLKQTHLQAPYVGWVSMSGPEIIFEYQPGPPASLKTISREDLPEEAALALDSGGDLPGQPGETQLAQTESAAVQTTTQPTATESGVSVKFSLGGIIGYTSQEVFRNYVSPYSATYLTVIEPILSIRVLFSLENKLRFGLGTHISASPPIIKLTTTPNDILMAGTLAFYGVFGYNNAYFHIGYDFVFGALYMAPSFMIGKHLMIGLPISLLGSNHHISIVSLLDDPSFQSDKWFRVGVSIQYVF
jgi:hypothetical protein